ncbi:unnamed protein product [Nyctereutes procyonoides]|uniref:(raccoon dog) hypothetical protein n=1 Tax=Nyctereutes procyonoides TaxID=34880 RepID=A0A811ZIJ8_NYCPR|nr:unnamed protein product [Nyctereutes procyonoides]
MVGSVSQTAAGHPQAPPRGFLGGHLPLQVHPPGHWPRSMPAPWNHVQVPKQTLLRRV